MKNETIRLTIEEAEKYLSLMDHEISARYYLTKYSRKYREQNDNIDYLEINKELHEEWKIRIK